MIMKDRNLVDFLPTGHHYENDFVSKLSGKLKSNGLRHYDFYDGKFCSHGESFELYGNFLIEHFYEADIKGKCTEGQN